MPNVMYDSGMTGWAPEFIKRRPEVTMEMVEKFLTNMYRSNVDFVYTVTRDFVRKCQTPVLILPDDVPAHPYAVAMEAAMLAPKARSEHVPVEGTEGTDSSGGTPDTFLPAGASARFCLDGSVSTRRPSTPGDRMKPCLRRLTIGLRRKRQIAPLTHGVRSAVLHDC